MKKCKQCQSEIDAKANKCPHCQSDQRNWFIRHPIITGFLILLIIGAIGAGSNKNDTKKVAGASTSAVQAENAANVAEEPTSVPKQTVYKIGDKVQSGDHVFSVNSVRKDAGSGFIKPKQDNTYLVVDATIENKSSEKVNISTLLQMYVKDSEGTKYTPTVGAPTKGSLDGEITAGDKSKGEVTFEVPTTATGFKFYYEAGWLTGSTIIVDLSQ